MMSDEVGCGPVCVQCDGYDYYYDYDYDYDCSTLVFTKSS